MQLDPGAGARHEVVPGTTIGRERCDILLDDEEVSRRHAAIRLMEDGIVVEDLGSRNGTFVNDERIDGAQLLSDGDVVRMGVTSWRFQVSADAETAFGQPPAAAKGEKKQGAAAAVVDDRPHQPSTAEAGSVSGQSRGDVPAPEVMPSAVRSLPAPDLAGPPTFLDPPRRRIRGSAARRGGALVVCYAVVILTAAAVITYLAMR